MSSTSASSGDKPALQTAASRPLPARTPTDTARQNGSFQRELDRLSKTEQKKDADKKDRSDDNLGGKRLDRLSEKARRDPGSDTGEQQGGELPSDRMTGALLRAGKVTAPPSFSGPDIPAEHLARIAAAIQELASSGANADFHLQLPAGSGMIQGAVLARDARGQLAIQLISAGNMAPHLAAQLRSDLVRRLQKKRLLIGSCKVTTGTVFSRNRTGSGA